MRISSIKKQASFVIINKQGAKFHTPYFILICKKNFSSYLYNLHGINKKSADDSSLMIGIKASKKLGNAVVRNKIRRRIKHLIRIISKDLKADKYGIVIVPRLGFEKTDFVLLLQEFTKVMGPYMSASIK